MMTRLKRMVLILVLLGLIHGLSACRDDQEVPKTHMFDAYYIKTFAHESPEHVSYEIELEDAEFIVVSGKNITSAHYAFDGTTLLIERDYLIGLGHGLHAFTLHTTTGETVFEIDVVAPDHPYRLINGGFETGDLFGWNAFTVFKGEAQLQAFTDDGVRGSAETGYVFGPDPDDRDLWNERMGVMESHPFVLGGSGYVTFTIGGAKNDGVVYLSVIRESDGHEIARYGNPLFEDDPEGLVAYRADLSDYLGERLFFRVSDYAGREGDHIALGEISTYHVEIPDSGAFTDASNIVPMIEATGSLQLENGDFSEGMTGWTEIGNTSAFHVEDGILKSNLSGDEATGLIRSKGFTLSGTGYLSFSLGAAKGERFDKDTVVFVREALTNVLIARYANERHQGTDLITYYADLSDHLGKTLYVEILDRGQGPWDTIFIDDIITYYEDVPEIDLTDLARNLNE